ncbi:MAG TPA: PAS domain-containing protein [Buttiauxella sp.]|uniref:PAS domain-containing protein n=1 Tax=Buttiauxella sp. TaxID=1972222 RepID=UPI002B46EF96|nr:PAS domain-containing protein [Buttiauxella sp.]HKM95314.1 PAS domain-containing protein [Buttiauxella sp.]
MTMNLMTDVVSAAQIAGMLSRQHPTLFFTLIEQAPVAITLTDTDARMVYANPAFCRQTGYALEQLLHQNPRMLASQQTPAAVYKEMWQTLMQGHAWHGQLINCRIDGSLYLADIDITPVINDVGEVQHYMAMHRDISDKYALEQRLRNHMTLMVAVLNNIPAAVVVVDENDQIVLDNLAYKTLCADCGGRELLTLLDYPAQKSRFNEGQVMPVAMRGAVRWLSVNSWALPGVSEEASRYFIDTALPRTLIMIADCTQQQHQQQLGRIDQLKQQITTGKLLAAIRESLDAALIQLNCPLNMLAAARRLNGADRSNIALEAAWREGEEALARLQRCRPSLDFEMPAIWPLQPLFDDVRALYQHLFTPIGALDIELDSPHLVGFGQRTQLLACLSLWLDRTLALAADIPAFQLMTQLFAREEQGWICFYFEDNIPLTQVRYTASPDDFNVPGKGMEIRLIQTLVAHHRGAIDLHSRSGGGTCLTLRLPLFYELTGGPR